MYLPFTQTRIWADLNQYHNQQEPIRIETDGVSCLFGFHLTDCILTSFNGPVIDQGATVDSVQNFLKKTLDEARKMNASHVSFRSLPPLRSWKAPYENEFVKLGFQYQEWKTLIIDLSPSEEELLKGFDHSARKGIKKAQSFDLRVERCDSFERFYENYLIPYFKVTNRALKAKSFYQKSWDIDTENIYTYWVAQTTNGEPLGFLGTYRYNGVATEIMSALMPLAFEKKIPVQDLLHWEIFKYHKGAGDAFFDLAGFNPNPVSEKEKNIRKFKEKWGGKVCDTSSYVLDRRPLFKKILSKVRKRINV